MLNTLLLLKNRLSLLIVLLAVSCQSPNVEKRDEDQFSFTHFNPKVEPSGENSPLSFLDDEEDQGTLARSDGFFANTDSRAIWPASGRVTSEFGPRRSRLHGGLDISSGRGTKIVAVEEGKVIFVGRKKDYGKLVILEHKAGYRTLYAHCGRIRNLKVSQKIDQGQVIAYMGSTGNARGVHLHFEYRTLDDKRLDPRMLLPRMNIAMR